MARYYGPADYDPDGVPAWKDIQRSIQKYRRDGYYNDAYYVPPEWMRQEYVSDQVLQEMTMAASMELEAAADALNQGVDAVVEAANEAVDAVAEEVTDTLNRGINAGAEAVSDTVNAGLETVLDTRHDNPVMAKDTEIGETVLSTRHGDDDSEEISLNPVHLLNRGINEALEEEKDSPSMLEVMGDASWQVASGLTEWADGVQQRHWSTYHEGRNTGQDDRKEADQTEVRDVVHSTSHGPAEAVLEQTGETDARQENTRYEASDAVSMASVFTENSGRVQSFQTEPANKTIFWKEQLSREEMQIRQMERYQKAMELVANIDFGDMFQRDFGMSL